MTAMQIVDLIKLLRIGDNKQTIGYIANILDAARKEGFDNGYTVGYNIGNLDGSDESCIGGIHD